MLTTIVKRNGTVEDFIPAKANHWAIWAGKGLEDRIDWPSVVRDVVRTSPDQLTSQEFQHRLIAACEQRYDYPHNLMAGRLYSVYLRKQMFGNEMPTVKQMHDKMVKLGLMLKPDYTDLEYDIIQNDILDLDLDFKLCHSQVKSIYSRYVLTNRVTGEKYELPQYTFMRMAMALCERYVGEERIERVRSFYLDFANNRVNAPTPNYTNLGTHQRSYASCCLYAAGDTAKSIGIANEIAYTMTTASAGIGGVKIVRSVMDPVRGGAIEHHGKFPYFRATAATVSSSQQGSRGGALTEYVSVFDPEIVDIAMAQNPRTALKAQIRECHFAVMTNTLFARKAAKRENIFTFNIFTAPDLMKKFFSADIEGFEELYNKYEADPNFKKNYLNAYDLAVLIETQPHEVSTMYWLAIDEVNRHTPFKDPILSSNLCLETCQPAAPYYDMRDLYLKDHERGEISTCNLGGIPISRINSEEEYEQAAYNALDMIDQTIHLAEYPYPHLEYTARSRMNAAVGMLGVAEYMAKRGIYYSSQYGLETLDFLAERHYYFLLKAALKLGKERGNAPWMHKTKWPEGWLPIDTYKRSVDKIVPHKLRYDWEGLRKEIIANGGIRFSVLCAHMPTETSSKAAGVPNGPYPVRALYLKKSDMDTALDWLAPDGDLYADTYEIAYDVPVEYQIKMYAVLQKWCDGSISADYYEDRVKNPTLESDVLVSRMLDRHRYGHKSKYYQNSLTSKDEDISVIKKPAVCTSGGCDL